MASKAQSWLLNTRIGRVVSLFIMGVLGTGIISATAGTPQTITRTETKTEVVAFKETIQEDETMLMGSQKVSLAGVSGSKQVTYEVIYRGGEELSRKMVQETIVTPPTDQITIKGVRSVVREAVSEAIPFATKNVNDSSIEKGKTALTVAGVVGEKTVTYEIVKLRSVEVFRTAVSEQIVKQPVTQVTAIGTKNVAATSTAGCSPHYSGCVPIASDVDCGSGSGNGPAYFYGTARVIGTDIYRLDADNDGIACE